MVGATALQEPSRQGARISVAAESQNSSAASSGHEDSNGLDVYGADQLDEIVSAARNNEIHFQRAFVGKGFQAVGRFTGSHKELSGDKFMIEVRTAKGEVDCITSDKAVLDVAEATRDGQQITIAGSIKDTVLGDLLLDEGCQVTPLSG
jgi:hypothetical protein